MLKNEQGGILIVDKPKGVSSHDIVNGVRKLYDTKQVGHTGTLDPLATGVLPVLVGRAVKASEYVTSENKVYRTILRLGIRTDTEDITGKILAEETMLPSEKTVMEAIASMQGRQLQTPPMYSAVKVNGRKLYDLARQGIEVEREAREIEISSLEARKIDEARYEIRIACSKGTYIRTVCSAIGEKLGCGGVMEELCREATGPFTLEQAIPFEMLKEKSTEERMDALLPIDQYFSEYEKISFPPFYNKLFCSGCEIYLAKIHADYPVGTRLRVYADGEFVALAEVRTYEDGLAVKAIKFFSL